MIQNKSGANGRKGFTIVELIVIIIVIGILATLAILGFGQWKKRALDTAVRSDLNGVTTAMEQSRNHGTGYPFSIPDAAIASNGVELNYLYGDSQSYCVESLSTEYPDLRYFVNTLNANKEPAKGTCEGGAVPAGQEIVTQGPWISMSHGAGVHTCGVNNNGKLYCWGDNTNGQLGDGTVTDRAVPTQVTTALFNGSDVSLVASGRNHTCAVANDKAYCWGINTYGLLGDGTTTQRTTPVAVSTAGVLNSKKVSYVGAGVEHSCALAEQRVYCWGSNYLGALGNGGVPDYSYAPVEISMTGALAGKTISQLYVGSYHNCVLAQGSMYCWGSNTYGQLGDGTLTQRNSPVAVNASGVLAGKTITGINRGVSSHTCAVASGAVYCWGMNSNGQLGNGTSGTDLSLPVAVTSTGVLSGKVVTSVTTGSNYTCATAEYKAYCWGMNGTGNLGNNTTTTSNVPVAVNTSGALSGKLVSGLTLGNNYKSCALTFGQIYCWGSGIDGQLGNGGVANSSVPVSITNP